MNNNQRLMLISALSGLVFFMIANFAHLFIKLNILSELIQIVINIFIFIIWLRGYRISKDWARYIVSLGIIAPPILAGQLYTEL